MMVTNPWSRKPFGKRDRFGHRKTGQELTVGNIAQYVTKNSTHLQKEEKQSNIIFNLDHHLGNISVVSITTYIT